MAAALSDADAVPRAVSGAKIRSGAGPARPARSRRVLSLMRPYILLLAVVAPVLPAAGDDNGRFGYNELAALVETHSVRHIEELLPRLPAELRAGYTLVYASRGLQGVSPEHPRVILFGRDARLIVAFNGDPSQPRHDELEILHYRERDHAFELRAVRFADGVARFSAPDPPLCLTCHGPAARPVWASYDYPRQRRHQQGAGSAGHRCTRQGEAARHADRVPELRLRARRGRAPGARLALDTVIWTPFRLVCLNDSAEHSVRPRKQRPRPFVNRWPEAAAAVAGPSTAPSPLPPAQGSPRRPQRSASTTERRSRPCGRTGS